MARDPRLHSITANNAMNNHKQLAAHILNYTGYMYNEGYYLIYGNLEIKLYKSVIIAALQANGVKLGWLMLNEYAVPKHKTVIVAAVSHKILYRYKHYIILQ